LPYFIRNTLIVALALCGLPLHAQQRQLEKIDSIIDSAIAQKAFPGAQLLIAKGGSLKVHKAYGYHTYDSIQKVELEHLYDLASMTKVLAATTAFMKAYEDLEIDLDSKVKGWFESLKWRRKGHSSFREILSHQAGWIPYIAHQFKVVKKNGRYRARTLQGQASEAYPMALYDSLYIHKNYPKKIRKRIYRTPVKGEGNYRYSGLWFFLVPDFIKEQYNQPFDEFLANHFYDPLGADRLTFNPYQKFKRSQIVPTEVDTLMRRGLVRAYVHDEAAALMGGISGNAGLFGNAESVFKVAEMWRLKGVVGESRYLDASTVDVFSAQAYPQNDNRRGLGFDKPDLTLDPPYPSSLISPSAFGHTGFTGTMVWVDPEAELVIVLLTNRVYPSREQRKLYSLEVREQLIDLALQLN
jgi:serine-type D-Ala-D-Ala carboxypeptidase